MLVLADKWLAWVEPNLCRPGIDQKISGRSPDGRPSLVPSIVDVIQMRRRHRSAPGIL
jgi:hypothetical protein